MPPDVVERTGEHGGERLVVGGALLWLQSDILGIPVYIATILNLIVTIPLNFLLNKFWVYRKKK